MSAMNKIRDWMLVNREDYVDPVTGELNCTELVEAWDYACSTGESTLDPLHEAWDIAVELDS